jgi:transcriptional regulator NrdR family protein
MFENKIIIDDLKSWAIEKGIAKSDVVAEDLANMVIDKIQENEELKQFRNNIVFESFQIAGNYRKIDEQNEDLKRMLKEIGEALTDRGGFDLYVNQINEKLKY